jgi:hypothetical protein
MKQETRSLLDVWDFAKNTFWAAKEGSGRLRWTAISGGVWIICAVQGKIRSPGSFQKFGPAHFRNLALLISERHFFWVYGARKKYKKVSELIVNFKIVLKFSSVLKLFVKFLKYVKNITFLLYFSNILATCHISY